MSFAHFYIKTRFLYISGRILGYTVVDLDDVLRFAEGETPGGPWVNYLWQQAVPNTHAQYYPQ